MPNLSKKLKSLPKSPGVYIFYDKNRKVLYVGKATSLKSRVGSYFYGVQTGNRPIEFFIDRIADIKIIKTDSVLEAYVLEQNLIKKIQPKYNAMGKDGKSFCYAVITKKDFPRILLLRKTELDKTADPRQYAEVYGPYISKKQIEIALKILRKIFPYHSRAQKTEKGCLDYQIGLCPGPYDGAITKKEYRENIRGIQMVLEGRKKSLVKKMEKEMREYSKNREYEKAAEIRNKIFALKHIQDVALITENLPHSNPLLIKEREKMRIEGYDISNISGQYATGAMVVFDNSSGELEPNKNEYRKFKIKTISGANDAGMMKEILMRRFKNSWDQPDLIILDGGVGHLNMGVDVLQSLGLAIPITAVAKGSDRKNLELRIENLESGNKVKLILEDKNLVKQIMDEAHRFAIGYHKKLRRKNFIGYLQNPKSAVEFLFSGNSSSFN